MISSCSYYKNRDYTDPPCPIYLKPYHCLGLLDERIFCIPNHTRATSLLLHFYTFPIHRWQYYPNSEVLLVVVVGGTGNMTGLHEDMMCTIAVMPVWLWECFAIHITNCRRYLPCVAVPFKSHTGFLCTYICTCPTYDSNRYNIQLLPPCIFPVNYCTHLS